MFGYYPSLVWTCKVLDTLLRELLFPETYSDLMVTKCKGCAYMAKHGAIYGSYLHYDSYDTYWQDVGQ